MNKGGARGLEGIVGRGRRCCWGAGSVPRPIPSGHFVADQPLGAVQL